jgi:hypothetical protein
MTYKEDEYNIQARTNDNFKLEVATGMNITSFVPKFKVKKDTGELYDLSSYITITNATDFKIDVNATELAIIGETIARYDCILELSEGNKEFLFGGYITITSGVA